MILNLLNLLNLGLLTKTQYDTIYPTGSSPAILYGLPKVHKKNTPLRPIMSSTNTFNRKLSQFLIPLLLPLTSNRFTVKSTFTFCTEINSYTHPSPLIMASLDIESLFTNVPLFETIEIVLELLFQNTTHVNGFNRKQFKQLLLLACTNNIFLFNGKLYLQKEGVAMGGCLSPILANIFMCYHEEKWLTACPDTFKPVLYRRYVDDTFLLFHHKIHIAQFKTYLNSKHPNITFTSENEVEGCLPFIGVNVVHQDLRFKTFVYRKPTDTGLGMNFFSFVCSSYKVNSILTMLHRCYSIVSNWTLFHDEVSYRHEYYINNNFPSSLFWGMVRKFTNRIMNPRIITYNVPKDKQYISLPFFGHPSYIVRNKLLSLFKIHFPQIDIKIVLTNRRTIGSLFPVKERLAIPLCSNVIYQYKCGDCSSSYVGSTERALHDRICEHKGVSFRTGIRLTSPSFSSIREHSVSCSHPIDTDLFRIIGRCSDHEDLRLLESVFIKHLKPDLNNTESAAPLYIL